MGRFEELIENKEGVKGEVQLFLDEKETRQFIKIGKSKIESCAWVYKNADSWDKSEEEKVRIKKNAKESAEFWERILDKIESQLG